MSAEIHRTGCFAEEEEAPELGRRNRVDEIDDVFSGTCGEPNHKILCHAQVIN